MQGLYQFGLELERGKRPSCSNPDSRLNRVLDYTAETQQLKTRQGIFWVLGQWQFWCYRQVNELKKRKKKKEDYSKCDKYLQFLQFRLYSNHNLSCKRGGEGEQGREARDARPWRHFKGLWIINPAFGDYHDSHVLSWLKGCIEEGKGQDNPPWK